MEHKVKKEGQMLNKKNIPVLIAATGAVTFGLSQWILGGTSTWNEFSGGVVIGIGIGVSLVLLNKLRKSTQ